MVYGDGKQYVAYSAAGVGHNLPVRENDVLDWFGITGNQFPGDGNGGTPTTTLLTTTTTPGQSTPTVPAPGGNIAKYGQW